MQPPNEKSSVKWLRKAAIIAGYALGGAMVFKILNVIGSITCNQIIGIARIGICLVAALVAINNTLKGDDAIDVSHFVAGFASRAGVGIVVLLLIASGVLGSNNEIAGAVIGTIVGVMVGAYDEDTVEIQVTREDKEKK